MTTSAVSGETQAVSLTPHLLITKGPQRGTFIELDFAHLTTKPLVLGRHPEEADVVLQSSRNRVSRRHVLLLFRPHDQLVIVADAGSSNGTQLNGEFIAGPTPLMPGDTIGCGDVQLVFIVPLDGMGLPLGRLPGQTERTYIEDSEPGVARLEILSSEVPGLRPGAFCRLTPQHPFVIGRYSTNDLPLLEGDEGARLVSRRHAEIRWSGGSYIIRDLGAANPAWIRPINESPLQLETPRQLQDDDRIVIGTTTLVYRAPRLPLIATSDGQPHSVATGQASLRFAANRPLQLGPPQLRLPTDRQILIGRDEGNDLRLFDRSVSRRHARLGYEARHFMLTDLGSANGTWLNGQAVTQPVVLQRGDRLQLGDFEFILDELSDEPGQSPVVSLVEPVLLQLGQPLATDVAGPPSPDEDHSADESLVGPGSQTQAIIHPLRHIVPFNELDGTVFNRLLPYFKEVTYKPGQEMAREGQNRGAFFAIIEGRVSISRALNDRQRLVLGQLEAGSVYGERMVMADKPFANRLEAVTEVRALRLEENAFVRDLSANPTIMTFFKEQVTAASATTWLRATLLMRNLREKTRQEIANRLRLRVYKPGEVLAQQGQPADEFFLLLSGTAVATITDTRGREAFLATLEEGDSFGDAIAVTGETYPMTVRVERQVDCYVLGRADFESVLAKSGDPIASLGAGLGGLPLGAVLNRVGPFMAMPPQLVAKIAAEMKPKFFKKGETIVWQDEPASAFYIIRSGQVEVSFKTSEGEVRSDMCLGPGQYFGEASLLTNTARTDSVRAAEDCELLALYHNRLDAVLKLGESYHLGQYFAKSLNKRFRPKQMSDVTITEHISAIGEHYFLLARAGGEQFFKLSESSLYLWNLMNGDNSLNDLSMAYFLEFKKLDLEGASNLVGQLQAAGFLEVPALDENLLGSAKKTRRGPFFRLFNWRYEFKRVDWAFDRLYRWGGQVFFWPPVVLLLFVTVVAGFGAFLYQGLIDAQSGTNVLKILQGGGLGAFTIPGALPWWSLLLVLLLNFVIHESAHGLALKAYGRRVLGGGFGLQNGGPVFFINTNEMWLEKRGPRIVVNLVGPFSNALFGGICCLLILITPNAELRTALFQMAAVAYTLVYLNINPLMELDGYYALMDWVEIPGLRRKALAYVRRRLLGRPQLRTVPLRERRIFWRFAAATPLYLIFTVVQFWFFLGSLLAGLGVLSWLASAGLSQDFGSLLLWLLTAGLVGLLAWPLFSEFATIGRDEEELEEAAFKSRRRKVK